MAKIVGYRRPYIGTQPNHLHPSYVSSIKRAPSKPLIYLPHTLSEITGPLFDEESVDVKASDLTKPVSYTHLKVPKIGPMSSGPRVGVPWQGVSEPLGLSHPWA